MSDLDYSPALNEDGTEFDIVKAAEIAKEWELRATVIDAGGGEVRLLVDRDTKEYPEIGSKVALASSPAPAGLDVERLATALDEAWSPDDVFADDHEATWRPLAERAAALYDLWTRAATRPAEDAG